MAQDRYAPLFGGIIALSGDRGPFRTCGYCGFDQGHIREGKGPHLGQIVCDNCRRHTAWIGRDHMEAMLAGFTDKTGLYGRPMIRVDRLDNLIDDGDAA